MTSGHVEGKGGLVGKGASPEGGDAVLVGGMMSGCEDEAARGGSVGERGLEGGGGSEGAGDTGDDLDGDVGGTEGFEFFSGPPEDEGVAGLQAKDGGSGACSFDHHGVDLGLSDARLAAALAHAGQGSFGVGEVENLGRNEIIVKNNGGGLEEAEGTEGEEVGVAGTSTCQVDGSGQGGGARRDRRHDLASSGPTLGLVRACWRARVRDGQPS